MTKRANLRLLEVFRAVVDAAGVTEAAARLNVSQPAVSKAIAQLETELGLRLFGRRHGRLHPTGDAQRLYAESERLFVQLATFQDRVRDLAAAREGELVLAAIPTLAASILSAAAARFCGDRPNVKIQIVAASAAAVAEMVGQHRADLGLVHSPVSARTVTGDVIGESEIVATMSDGHPLARLATVTPTELEGEPLILNDTASPPTHLVHETFARAHRRMHVVIEANSSAVGSAAASAGFGIALIDPWPNHPTPRPGLALRKFRPRVPLRIVLLHSMFRPPSRLAEAFRADLEAVLAEAAKASPFIIAR